MTIINRSDIYDKNLSFLIGSGASVGILPTLELKIKQSSNSKPHTLETLATLFEDDEDIMCLLFSYYVENVIAPAANFDVDSLKSPQRAVLINYIKFLKSILAILNKKGQTKRANIFTTNYDGLIAHCAERMLQSGKYDFILNDGSIGFVKRTLQTRSFNRYVKDQGTFDQHEISVPQINLIQPHGSVYWYKDGENIEVSYDLNKSSNRATNVSTWMTSDFEDIICDETLDDSDIDPDEFVVPDSDRKAFWDDYRELPIVNPTKWKFHETVFEEHYYQSLRALSYELERPNSVFIIFGFSFADEHILSLVKRSLSNPTLKVFICCYSDSIKSFLEFKFSGFDNVQLIRTVGALNFDAFNNDVFSANPPPPTSSEK
ncbi:SIR2 family protein [Loktanella salsilacus]|uniref:SIR2 family protein n=1 Tax=Loktanella salsilacus TaxID=195913 RepID=UPI0020B6AAD5|nr:SIR2 family protein [Loktanella salsilacus]UTH48790.1 SIR2 family protein [Loktanella salsilacus]